MFFAQNNLDFIKAESYENGPTKCTRLCAYLLTNNAVGSRDLLNSTIPPHHWSAQCEAYIRSFVEEFIEIFCIL